MGPYDLTMKRLTSEFAEDYVRFALNRIPSHAEALELEEVEEVDKELPALMREVDFAARVEVEQRQIVLLLEFQTRWEADVPQRMMGYTWRLYERYKLPVYPVVMVFRKSRSFQDRLNMQALEMEVVRFRYRVIPIWEVDARQVIEQGQRGLYPLLPLMRWEGKGAEEVLEEIERLVLGEIKDRERRADAYVALRVLSGIGYPLVLIDRIMRRRDIMLESPVYREILEEGKSLGLKEGLELGRKEGLELGRKEGLEFGEEARLREDVLDVLDVRFGVVPPDVEETVRSVRGKASLESLLRRVAVVESVEAFREHLTKLREA